jgi:hypothetical protein
MSARQAILDAMNGKAIAASGPRNASEDDAVLGG